MNYKNENLFPHKPFHNIEQFCGTLCKGTHKVNSLHIAAQYVENFNSKIECKIIGSNKAYKRIMPIMHESGLYSTIHSDRNYRADKYIYSNTVSINNLSAKSISSEDDDALVHEVANLHLSDLYIIEKIKHNTSGKRYLTFFLTGPKSVWNYHEARCLSWTGEITVDHINGRDINIDSDLPFSIQVRPWYFYDKRDQDDGTELTTHAFSLNFITDKSTKELSDKSFLVECINLANDITLLMSLLSRKWIMWYRYTLLSVGILKTYIREVGNCPEDEPDRDDLFIEPHRSIEFIKTALPILKAYRKSNRNIEPAIYYILLSNKSRTLEEKFIIGFLALEVLKDIYLKEVEQKSILSKKQFSQISKQINKLLDTELNGNKALDKIVKKIPELNRLSFKDSFLALCDEYSIQWTDLYPHKNELSFINARNKVFHSGSTLDSNLLMKEEARIQILSVRLITRMLGWRNIESWPKHYIKEWLSK